MDRVLHGWLIRDAAEAAGISQRTACKWLKRYREEGERGLADRSSAPRRVANRTAPERVQAILALRELRFTAAEIAETLGIAHSTVSAVLKRHGRGRLPRLDADRPENRYERAQPGELVHIDVKKLGKVAGVGHRITGQRRVGGGDGRGPGWEFVHVCVDDCTRLAYVEVLESERADAVCAFLERAVRWFATHGIRVERVMTDGCCFYVKLTVPVRVLQWIVTLRVRRLGVLVGMVVAGSGWSRCQTRRARWRLRQRIASRRVLPSACLRAR